MRLLDLHIDGFAKFHHLDLSLDPGINVIYGSNEAGKSTIHAFLRAMLFGFTRARGTAAEHDLYARMTPWDKPEEYGGHIRVEADGITYTISRTFTASGGTLRIRNEVTGKEEADPQSRLQQLLGGLSETAYCNTVSIGQLKSATEHGMIRELRQVIGNMSTSASMDLDVSAATDALKRQKEQYASRLMPDASRDYTALLTRLRDMRASLGDPAYRNDIADAEAACGHLKADRDEAGKAQHALAAELAECQKQLESAGLTDRASAKAMDARGTQLWQDYKSCAHTASSTGRRILPPLLILSALGLTALSWLSLRSGSAIYPYIWHSFGNVRISLPGLAAPVLLILGLALHSDREKNRKTAELCKNALGDLLRPLTGSGAAEESNLSAFHQKLEELSALCDRSAILQQSLAEGRSRLEELDSLTKTSADNLLERRNIQWTLEQKLDEIALLQSRADALKAHVDANQKIRRDMDAVDLAAETLEELSRSVRSSFGLYLNRTASQLIAGITGGAYTSMDIDSNMNILLNDGRRMVPLEQVSSGTADQIWLAVRMAAARLVLEKNTSLPLIFDDSFVLYDKTRLTAALTWLARTAGTQVLIFTCHPDEEELLTQSDVKHKFIRL